MATYRYLCDWAQNVDDPSITEPAIAAEFPDLTWSIEDTSNNPEVPDNRVLIKVTDATANEDRMIMAMDKVSKYVPPNV